MLLSSARVSRIANVCRSCREKEPFLACVDDILTKCTDFVGRAFALHAGMQVRRGGKLSVLSSFPLTTFRCESAVGHLSSRSICHVICDD